MDVRWLVVWGAVLGVVAGGGMAAVAFGFGATMALTRVLALLWAGAAGGAVLVGAKAVRMETFLPAAKGIGVRWVVYVALVLGVVAVLAARAAS